MNFGITKNGSLLLISYVNSVPNGSDSVMYHLLERDTSNNPIFIFPIVKHILKKSPIVQGPLSV